MKIEVIDLNKPEAFRAYKAQELIQRSEKMLLMYCDGKTLAEIGEKFFLSRERIRQTLTRFPSYHEYKKENGSNLKVGKKIEKECKFCKELFKTRKEEQIFCTVNCGKGFIWRDLKEKKCINCGITKPINDFYSNYTAKSKYCFMGRCKKCFHLVTKSWEKRNPEKVREYSKRAVFKYTHKGKCKECGKICYSKSKHSICFECYKKSDFFFGKK